MRANPAELAAWTAQNARARMAYDADKQKADPESAPTSRPCLICGERESVPGRNHCQPCVRPLVAERVRRHRAKKKASR